MAGAEGLLEAQQRAALEIPYKNIEQFQKSLEGAFNAFAVTRRLNLMSQEVDRKRQQLESQLDFKEQQLAEKTRQDEFLDKMRQQQVDQSARGRDIAEQRLDIYSMLANNKLDQQEKKLSDQKDFAEYMQETGKVPGDTGWLDAYFSGTRMFTNAGVKLTDAIKIQNTASNQRRRALEVELENTQKDFTRNLYGEGGSRNADMRPILDPERFTTPDYRTVQSKDEIAAKKDPVPAPRGATTRFDAATKKIIPVEFEKDKHGNMIQDPNFLAVPVTPRSPLEKDPFVHMPRNQLTDYINKLSDIKKRGGQIAPEIREAPTGAGAVQIFTPEQVGKLSKGTVVYWIDPNDPQQTKHYSTVK